MELKVTTLDGGEAGSVTLSDAIFGLDPRTDIIHRCVVWQLAKRRAGTHAVKNRADIARTGKKMYRQKGTGSARHGSARVNLFRGGGRSLVWLGPAPDCTITISIVRSGLRRFCRCSTGLTSLSSACSTRCARRMSPSCAVVQASCKSAKSFGILPTRPRRSRRWMP